MLVCEGPKVSSLHYTPSALATTHFLEAWTILGEVSKKHKYNMRQDQNRKQQNHQQYYCSATQNKQKLTCDLIWSQEEEGSRKEAFFLIWMSAADLDLHSLFMTNTGEILILPLGVAKYSLFLEGLIWRKCLKLQRHWQCKSRRQAEQQREEKHLLGSDWYLIKAFKPASVTHPYRIKSLTLSQKQTQPSSMIPTM